MKNYETVFILNPVLSEDQAKDTVEKFVKVLKKGNAEILNNEQWGLKKLAYPIKREEFAVYVYMDVELPADAPLKISNTFNITDEVLRYLLVTVDEKARKALEEQARQDARGASENVKEEE